MDSSRLVGGMISSDYFYIVCYSLSYVLYNQFCGKIGQKMESYFVFLCFMRISLKGEYPLDCKIHSKKGDILTDL